MNQNSLLINLLHITDSTLPIGSFSHSNGLETYVQKGLVCDAKTAKTYISNILKYNYKYNDGFFCKEAHRIVSQGEKLKELIRLDNEWNAFITPYEVRIGSAKLGIRLLKIYLELIPNQQIRDLYTAIKSQEMAGHFAILFGALTAIMKIKDLDSLRAFYYNAISGMVTNSVKLIPLGQIEGQKILHQSFELIETTACETVILETKYAGMCMPSLDIRCMQHEQLYSRLYMS